jgi:hypothetical protein
MTGWLRGLAAAGLGPVPWSRHRVWRSRDPSQRTRGLGSSAPLFKGSGRIRPAKESLARFGPMDEALGMLRVIGGSARHGAAGVGQNPARPQFVLKAVLGGARGQDLVQQDAGCAVKVSSSSPRGSASWRLALPPRPYPPTC